MMRLLLIVLPLCGIALLSQGAYIHTKALLAQFLLKEAWAETTRGRKEVKPWPWSDTWPVGRLSVPGLGISRIVLAGASGSSLAFGPGHLFNSAKPGAAGNTVIAGHRDTHFRFLRELKPGDILELEDTAGARFHYRVVQTLVTDENQTGLLEPGGPPRMTLVTCYPFEALSPGGPLRYVVSADRTGRVTNVTGA